MQKNNLQEIMYEHGQMLMIIIQTQTKNYYNLPVDNSDILNESLPKLLNIIEKYDSNRGVTLETYISSCYVNIVKAIIRKYMAPKFRVQNQAKEYIDVSSSDEAIVEDEDSFYALLDVLTSDERMVVYRIVILRENKSTIVESTGIGWFKLDRLLDSIANKLKSINDI